VEEKERIESVLDGLGRRFQRTSNESGKRKFEEVKRKKDI
jgi:hypothetical protein